MAFLWLINGGDPNHLLSGMLLQVRNLELNPFFATGILGGGWLFSVYRGSYYPVLLGL